MASKPLVNSYFYLAIGKPNGELACYVAGFGTKVRYYQKAIKTLQKLGYDVIAFDYTEAVLRGGDPQLLLDIVADVTRQVSKKSRDYKETLCMGVSLGSFIGYNVQKRVANAYVGAYAVAGVDMAGAMFSTIRTFKKMAKKFKANGYPAKKLNEIWAELDAEPPKATFPANKSFIAYDGTADRIVNFKEASKNIKMWADKGIRVKQYVVRHRGHMLTALYFINHTASVVAKAKAHHAATTWQGKQKTNN